MDWFTGTIVDACSSQHRSQRLEDNGGGTSIAERTGHMRRVFGVEFTGPNKTMFTRELRKTIH